MQTNTNNTESTTDFTTTENEEITVEDLLDLTSNNNVDDGDFGYDNDNTPAPKNDPPPVDDETPVDDGEKKTLTGYEDDGEVEETPPPEKKEEKPFDPATATEEEKAAHAIAEAVKELPETLDKEKIQKFAKDNNLTPDQLKSYGKLVQEESEAFAKQQAEAIKTRNAAWKKEIKEDPEIGGKNFDHNIKQINKVLENNLPNMKKQLTEKAGMMPPYLMRDLFQLSKALYPKTPLVHGDPSEAGKKKSNDVDDFYA